MNTENTKNTKNTKNTENTIINNAITYFKTNKEFDLDESDDENEKNKHEYIINKMNDIINRIEPKLFKIINDHMDNIFEQLEECMNNKLDDILDLDDNNCKKRCKICKNELEHNDGKFYCSLSCRIEDKLDTKPVSHRFFRNKTVMNNILHNLTDNFKKHVYKIVVTLLDYFQQNCIEMYNFMVSKIFINYYNALFFQIKYKYECNHNSLSEIQLKEFFIKHIKAEYAECVICNRIVGNLQSYENVNYIIKTFGTQTITEKCPNLKNKINYKKTLSQELTENKQYEHTYAMKLFMLFNPIITDDVICNNIQPNVSITMDVIKSTNFIPTEPLKIIMTYINSPYLQIYEPCIVNTILYQYITNLITDNITTITITIEMLKALFLKDEINRYKNFSYKLLLFLIECADDNVITILILDKVNKNKYGQTLIDIFKYTKIDIVKRLLKLGATLDKIPLNYYSTLIENDYNLQLNDNIENEKLFKFYLENNYAVLDDAAVKQLINDKKYRDDNSKQKHKNAIEKYSVEIALLVYPECINAPNEKYNSALLEEHNEQIKIKNIEQKKFSLLNELDALK